VRERAGGASGEAKGRTLTVTLSVDFVAIGQGLHGMLDPSPWVVFVNDWAVS
jgi:hypothetical protein